MIILWISLAFCVGVVFGAWWRARPDEVCRMCRMSYNQEIEGLKKDIHGLKSTKGALAKEVQALSFRNAGYKAR